MVSQVGVLPFFCNATIRDVVLDLPGKGIDTSLFDRTICTVEWNIAAQELYAFLYGPQVEQLVSRRASVKHLTKACVVCFFPSPVSEEARSE